MRDIDAIEYRLVHAVTTHDRKQACKRGYNHYALAQYLAAVTEATESMRRGTDPRRALEAAFNDRLLDVCLKVID
jgi:hypothetical protein